MKRMDLPFKLIKSSTALAHLLCFFRKKLTPIIIVSDKVKTRSDEEKLTNISNNSKIN